MQRTLRTKLPSWLRLAVLAAIGAGILAGSLIPDFAPPSDYGFDQIVHASCYAGFAMLCVLLFRRSLIFGAALFGFSIMIELLQMAVPGRTGSWEDVAANLAGIVAGIAIVEFAVMRARTSKADDLSRTA
ncbi:VanZ family protein [Methyloligella sp. 2.7D]|uniref:VanZ family protein n=1 Tax=unclassified Methyloligella TaxID=2625955 RepID=UPI00157BE6DA|nr:VanZ family protein [Methyloligella sp. GL2]QKP78192.1 VanZ family protein [Methyloligella sp. GL2]